MEQNESDVTQVQNAADDSEEISWDDAQQEVLNAQAAAKTEISMASFDEVMKADRKGGSSLDIDFILDIPLSLAVELGRSKMLIGELIQLGQGSVIELTKVAGEPMDVFVNQRLIARGEVVVVNEKFGVRLTDIISPAERINKLA
jgi:flagellar motor switch protein FliN/FliY